MTVEDALEDWDEDEPDFYFLLSFFFSYPDDPPDDFDDSEGFPPALFLT